MDTVQLRRIHKWIFVFLGALMLMWLATAILMALPRQLLEAAPAAGPMIPDYRTARLSPAEALTRHREATASTAPTRSVELRAVLGRAVYVLRLAGEPRAILDAASGAPFEITAEMARDEVRRRFPREHGDLVVTRLDRHAPEYPSGGLPMYLVAPSGATHAYLIDPFTGRVEYTTATLRAHGALVALHDFSALETLLGGARGRKLAVLLTAALGLVGSLIGLYLALPRRRPRGGAPT